MLKSAKSTVIGLSIGIMCIVIAIAEGGQPGAFLNWPSVFITVGGTLGAVVVSFPPKTLRNLGPVMRKAFTKEKYDIEKDIENIIALSEITRKEGLLALEGSLDQYTDDIFMKRGLSLIIDGADEEQLRNSLEGELYFMRQRHQRGSGMLDMIATTCPALGLMGTYIGLIPMLNSLEDPTRLGPLMALELVTSFYGAFTAYVVFSPLSKRLKIMNQEEVMRIEVLIEGLTYIQQGKNPKLVAEELFSFMNIKKKAVNTDIQQQNIFRSKGAA